MSQVGCQELAGGGMEEERARGERGAVWVIGLGGNCGREGHVRRGQFINLCQSKITE